MPVKKAGTSSAGSPGSSERSSISFVYKPQALEGPQVIDQIDAVAEPYDHASHPTGRDRGHTVPQLGAQLPADAVHLGGEAVHDPRLDGRLGRLADQRARFGDVDLGEPGGPRGERLDRDLDPG